jgi:hypothetical protein
VKKVARLLLVVPPVVLLGLASCSSQGSGGASDSPADTLTRRQKDSLVSTMPVPGAGAVGKAMEAADSAAARAARHDSLLNHY